MSKPDYIVNTFEKGLFMDTLPERQPDGTYSYALNAVHESREHSGVLVNEQSLSPFANIPGTIVGGSYIDERNSTLWFSSDGGLYLMSNETGNVQFVMRDSEAGCNWGFGRCEFMYGVFKNMQPCNDLHVYFSSDCHYYVVNIDEMLNPERRACALQEGCNYFRLFRCLCGPKITPTPVEGGGFLAAGSYQFIAQLEDNDGNQTNWFDLSAPVYVGSENNIGGEIGNWSIKVQIDQLEKGYNVLNLAVVKRIKGVTIAEILPPLAYNSKSVTYEYYGDNPDVTPVQLEEILVKGKKYLRGKDQVQKDGRLFLYNIRQDILPNYQPFANQIQVRWREFEVSAQTQARYHFPSLMRGETYAVAIVLKYCDGTYSHAFHIPAGGGDGGGGVSPLPESPQGGTTGSGIAGSPQGGDIGYTIGGQMIKTSSEPPSHALFLVQTLPYSEGFETTFSDWMNLGDYDWIKNSGSTPVMGTGPDDSSEGSNYLYAPGEGNVGKEAVIQSPTFDLNNLKSAYVSFDYFMYGSEVDSLRLEVSTDLDTYYPLFTRSTAQGNVWKSMRIPLFQFIGTFVTFRFIATTKGSLGDIAIDNFQLITTEPEALALINIASGGGGGTGSEGGGSAGVGSSAQYDSAVYETEEAFKRMRNPDCPDDVREQNDELEERILEDIEAIDSHEKPQAADGAEHYGEFFQTPELGETWQQDIDDISDAIQNAVENLTEYTQDNAPPKICPPLGETPNIKEVAKKLQEEGVIDREYYKVKKIPWEFSKGGRYTGGGGSAKVANPVSKGDFNPGMVTGSGASNRGDQWVNAYGEDIIEESPRLLGSGGTEVYTSNIPYPNICDCNGQPMFPSGNIRHHTMPDNCQSTHYVSNVVGTIHKRDGANVEWHDTYVRLLGLELDNIYLPTDEELPKPLCPISPFKIVIAKRDLNDRSIIAKGLVTACFTGVVRGREHAFPKHGVNSFECVDRYIENGDSKIGTNSSPNCYNFHSLDTNAQKLPLSGNRFKNFLELYGSGWRHGLYAKGKTRNWFTDSRVDQRGARQSVSLPGQLCKAGEADITGISYAPADSVVSGGSISVPLMNRNRESSVYMQLSGGLPGLSNGKRGAESDASFVGDVLDHECPIKTAAAWYGAVFRDIPDQYGTVENMRYIDSGINATAVHGMAGAGSRVSISGITGDVFIGPYSFRRTGYVSNKVGDKFPVANGSCDGRDAPWKRERDICDHPWDMNFQYLGLEHWPTRLPESGDAQDPKNWAGLHTTGVTDSCECAANKSAPDSDYYYPKVQKTLVTYWGEFEVNPYFRQTGEGPQKETGKVFYGKLKDLFLDSSDSEDRPWEDCWLNRFYCRVEQPSVATLTLKSIIRTGLGLIAPALAAAAAIELESIPDSILTFVVFPLLAAVWNYMLHTTFSDEWVDKILHIPRCRRDEEGGEDERCDRCPQVTQFEDNYHAYQFDFSKRNDVQSFYGIPRNYNTCKCDNCDYQTTQEVYYSEKQVLTSQIDAYRNFKSNNFRFIPAHAGYLKKLFVESGRFYAHCTDGIWLIKYSNALIPSTAGNLVVGKGDLLTDPELIMEFSEEGYAGLQDTNAAISTNTGYYWPDAEGNCIYRLYGGQIERISDYGVKNWFKRGIKFCNPQECRDEKVRGVYYSLGYDHRHNRLLFTKKDGDTCSSWTMSYDPEGKRWISFHSYLPMMYMWDRNHVFSVKPGTGEVWIHDNNHKNYQTYYGSYQPFIIDFPAKMPSGEAWKYYNTLLDTEAQMPSDNDYLLERHKTFTHVALWSGTQSTGLRKLSPRTDRPDEENDLIKQIRDKAEVIDAVYYNSQWRIHELYDFIIDCEAKVVSRPCECSPFVELRDVYKDNLCKQTEDGRTLSQRYLMYRYMINDPQQSNIKLYVKSNLTYLHEQT